ncbi:histone H1 [Methylobacterium sp. DM1]|nr:histone H1 [Methylobacterium sp. DM1]
MTTPRRPRDPNQLAKFIVDAVTGDEQSTRQPENAVPVSPATEFARSGGLKGGRARAESLSPEERSRIARQAAAARWRKDDS